MNRERLYPRRTNFPPALGRCKLCSYSPIINTSSHEPSKVGNRCECRGVSAEMQKAKCVNSQDNENKQAARTNKMNGVRGWAKRQIKIIKKKKINIIIKITHSPAQGKKSESRETKKKNNANWLIDLSNVCHGNAKVCMGGGVDFSKAKRGCGWLVAAAAWPCPYLCLRLWRVCDLTDKLTARRAQRQSVQKAGGLREGFLAGGLGD